MTQGAGHTVDIGVVGAPAALGTHQGVGRADQLSAFGSLISTAQRGELSRHGDRNTNPFRPETAYHRGQFVGCAGNPVVGPVVETQCPVSGQMQLRRA